MFVVKASNVAEVKRVKYMLHDFNVLVNVEHKKDTLFVVKRREGNYGPFRLAEILFQMNYHQCPINVCPVCASNGENLCGHLYFDKPIEPVGYRRLK